MGSLSSELKELPVPVNSSASGKAIFELELPDEFLVILIARDNDFILPNGGTTVQDNDVLLVLSDAESFNRVAKNLSVLNPV